MNFENYKYLDTLPRKLDDSQKECCCTKSNTIVAAGAGSGKTQVLATRFAWLLMEDENLHVPEILTLTFTDKAASEMYDRIYKTLEHFAKGQENLPEEKRMRAQRALEEFSSSHIQTLDSYCGSVLRQSAVRYGLTNDFAIGFSSSDIEDKAMSFVLKNIEEKGIQFYIKGIDLEKFVNDYFVNAICKHTTLATQKNYFSSFLDRQVLLCIKQWNSFMDYDISDCKIGSCFEDIKNILNGYKNDIIPDSVLFTTLKKLNESNLEFAKIDLQNIDQNTIAKFFLMAEELNSVLISCPKNQSAKDLNDNVQSKALTNLLKYINGGADGTFTENKVKYSSFELVYKSIYSFVSQYEYLKNLFSLMDSFTEEINNQKRLLGKIDFSDVSEMCLKTLIEQKDIRQQEKLSFKKIMIDEFQDNNGKNRDLLFLLSELNNECNDIINYSENPEAIHDVLKNKLEKEKLYFVGDEKQSIYKFRGADVSVFNQLKEDLMEYNGKDAYKLMMNNYRSDKELIQSFNYVFGKFYIENGKYEFLDKSNVSSVFSAESKNLYDAVYNEDAIARCVDKVSHKEVELNPLNEDNCKMHVAYYTTEDEVSDAKLQKIYYNAEYCQYFFIAEKIKELHDKQKIPYNSFAILDRNRTHRKELILALDMYDVPYNLDVQSSLFSDAVPNDIYNFLRLCVYPADMNSFAAYLNSPLCGLTGSVTETILAYYAMENKTAVHNAFDEEVDIKIFNELKNKEIELERYKNAGEYFKSKRAFVLSHSITDSLNEIWFNRGLRYETLMDEKFNMYENQYDFLFELCRSNEDKDISWFIDQLDRIRKNEGKNYSGEDVDIDLKEISFPLEKSDAVEIMTIHKSKGLQFEYVFLLNCLSKPSSNHGSQYYYDDEFGLSLTNPETGINFLKDYKKESDDNMNLAEFKRVVYVGVTRAIKEIYLVGKFEITKKGVLSKTTTGVLSSLIDNFYDIVNNEEPYVYAHNAPFDLYKIPERKYSDYNKSGNVNADSLRSKKIKIMDQVLSSKKYDLVEKTECNDYRFSPSSMEQEYNEINISKKSSVPKNDILIDADEIVKSYMAKDEDILNFKKLGTMVHYYFELYLNNISFDKIYCDIKELYKNISEADLLKLHNMCKTSVEQFVNSDIGKKILEAKNAGHECKTEYEFNTFIDPYLIDGFVDLWFEDTEGNIIIVDYKTDHEIIKEKYTGQQSMYKAALSEILSVEKSRIKCFLYYVRFNELIDISDDTNTLVTAEEINSILAETL